MNQEFCIWSIVHCSIGNYIHKSVQKMDNSAWTLRPVWNHSGYSKLFMHQDLYNVGKILVNLSEHRKWGNMSVWLSRRLMWEDLCCPGVSNHLVIWDWESHWNTIKYSHAIKQSIRIFVLVTKIKSTSKVMLSGEKGILMKTVRL